jgi:ABC-type cobalamin/Fe3+-siderophores transport system ATPase subunit
MAVRNKNMHINEAVFLPRFSPDNPVSSTSKTDHHDITEILLKMALNTISQPNYFYLYGGKCKTRGKQNK